MHTAKGLEFPCVVVRGGGRAGAVGPHVEEWRTAFDLHT
jgi:hypothetical protein